MESAAWYADGEALHRFVCDLVAGEFAYIRPGRPTPPKPWAPELRLDEAGVGADSLDRLKLATALSSAIEMHKSGVDDSLLAQATIGEWVETAARALAGFSAELTFATSGSTGRPKWCVHALADLDTEIDGLTARFAACRRVISAVPSHHIYGFLFTILLPLRLGAQFIDVRSSSPARLANLSQAGDMIVGHPAFWAAFVRGVPRTKAGVRGVTSTAPCPPEVAQAVTATGIASLFEVYGSSETAGIGWRDDPAAAYALWPYWRRGTADGELIRLLPRGGERVVRAPDRLTWDDARHFRPAGREDGAVAVGGSNVFPLRVREVLRRHPGVADAAVRLMRPDEGDRLKAFVVPRYPNADYERLRAELWSWLDARLAVPERPASIELGLTLPIGALGKSADWFAQPRRLPDE